MEAIVQETENILENAQRGLDRVVQREEDLRLQNLTMEERLRTNKEEIKRLQKHATNFRHIIQSATNLQD